MLPGGNVVLNRVDSYFWNHPMAIVALTPIDYVSTNTHLDREDTASGWHWDQDNYFFSITTPGHYIHHADINGGAVGPNYWSIISRHEHPNWHFIWNFGPRTQMYFGELNISMWVNQRPNAVCLTRLASTHYDSGYRNGYGQSRFTIYDQYGNSGLFSAVRDEGDWGNTLWVAQGDHNSKG